MLSRLLSARGLAMRSGGIPTRSIQALPKWTPVLHRRDVHSSPALQNAASAANPAESEGIIAKYGTIPFWGMVGTILVSKELLVVDCETLLALQTGIFFTGVYITIGDSFTKWWEAGQAKTRQQFADSHDYVLENISQYKAKQEAMMNKPQVMEQYLAEYQAAIKSHAAYQTVLPKHAARAKILATLEQIKNREEEAALKEWQNTVDAAVANVTAKVTGADNALKEELIDFAIANMCMRDDVKLPAVAPEADPVMRLFLNEFKD